MGILSFARRNDDAQGLNVEERLKQLEIFSKLTDKQIRKLAQLCVVKRYPKGEVFIRKGDTGLGMYLIVSGTVEVFDTRDGGRVTLATLDAGKVVGEMALMDARPRSAYVEAMADTECLLITRDSFNSLTRRDPEILWGIVPLLAERLRHADKRLAEIEQAQSAPAAAVTVIPAAGAETAPAVVIAVAPAAEDTALAGVKKQTAKKHAATDADDEDDEEEEDDDEDDEDKSEKKDGDSMLRSMTQLSTASFLLVSSTFLLGAQESLRFVWSKDSLTRSLGKNEEAVSSIASHVEGQMNDETKRLYTEFQDLMNSIMKVFER